MGIGDRLADSNYIPSTASNVNQFDYVQVVKCPVTFTNDPLEYAEGFLQYKLKPVQRQVLEDLFTIGADGMPVYNHAVFISGMRCLGLGTEVLMYDGTLKKVEDVATGDLLMGPDSKPRTVLSTTSGESELYKIGQSCAMEYVVNESHVLSLKKAQSAKGAASNAYGNAFDRFTDYPDIVNISIKDYLSKSNKWKYFFRGYTAGCVGFDYQTVPIDPYLLGVWLGDGVSRCLQICSADTEIVDWLKNYAVEQNLLVNAYEKKDNLAVDYTLSKERKEFRHSNPVWEEFRKLKLEQNKHIPDCYIANSKDIRLKVLAGIVDTDGTYVKHGYEITLANEKLIKDVKRLADSLGYRTNLRKKITTCQVKSFVGVAWRLSIHGSVWEIPCLIERKKYKHTGKYSNKENGLSSLKVESIGKGKYAGFTVDGDNLFCLSDGTATHNSGKSVTGGIIGSFLLQKLLAMDNPGEHLGQVPGQKFVAEYIATSEQQSKQTAYASFVNIISNTDWWRKYIGYLRERELKEGKETLVRILDKSIIFPSKNLEAHSLHSNSASIAGFTAFFVCFDEMSRFDVSDTDVQQQSEKRSAQAVYYTAARAAKTLNGFSKILTITSPMYETDFGMQLLYMSKEVKAGPSTKKIIDALRTRYTTRVDDIIGYHYCTYEANPKTDADKFGYTSKSFDAEKAANYSAFMRDYMAIPPAAISPFFELPERIDRSVYTGRDPLVIFTDEFIHKQVGSELRKYIGKRIQVINSNKIQKYFICCDQGAVKDSFVVAMGHGETSVVKIPDARGNMAETTRHKVIIDFVEAWKPNKEERITVSFENVEDVIKVLNSCYYIDRVVFDQWSSIESIERLFSEGIMTKKLGADLEMYETFKILLYSGMIDLPDNDKLLTELRQLSIIKNKKIDHPPEGCFSQETRIRLLNGTAPTIGELAALGPENEFWVYSCLPDGTIVPARAYNAHKTKDVTELILVKLDNGETIRCTPNHLFMIRDGTYVQAMDLKKNYSLMPLYTKYKKVSKSKKLYELVKIKSDWRYTHRVVFKFLNGWAKRSGHAIHHADLNPLNNSPDNLKAMLVKEHALLHAKLVESTNSPERNRKRSETLKNMYKNNPEFKKLKKKNLIDAAKNYWDSPEGKARRKELSKTQLKEAQKKRCSTIYKKRIEALGDSFNYIISYKQLKAVGGDLLYWKKRFSKEDFIKNSKKLENLNIEDIESKTRLQFTSVKRIIKRLNYPEKNNHKVVSIKKIKLKSPIPVYDITVPVYNNFALDSGIFVHNSKDLADAIIRVVWCVYLDSIRDAVHGKFMLPIGQQLSTVRSVATAFEIMKSDIRDEMPNYGIFAPAGSSKSVFGKSTIVQGNVIPNIGDTYLK